MYVNIVVVITAVSPYCYMNVVDVRQHCVIVIYYLKIIAVFLLNEIVMNTLSGKKN